MLSLLALQLMFVLEGHSQLHEDIKEVRPEAFVVVVLAEVCCDLNGFILRQFGRTCDVQQQASQLGEGRLLVAAAGRIVSTASLGTAAVLSVSVAIIV